MFITRYLVGIFTSHVWPGMSVSLLQLNWESAVNLTWILRHSDVCEAALFMPFCMNHSSFSLTELKRVRRLIWLRSVEGIMSGISYIISECMCVWPSLPSASAPKTHYSVYLWLSTEVLCTSMSERGIPVFQLTTAVLQNALKIPRLLKELHQHFLNCLLPVSMTPQVMCPKYRIRAASLFKICSRVSWSIWCCNTHDAIINLNIFILMEVNDIHRSLNKSILFTEPCFTYPQCSWTASQSLQFHRCLRGWMFSSFPLE